MVLRLLVEPILSSAQRLMKKMRTKKKRPKVMKRMKKIKEVVKARRMTVILEQARVTPHQGIFKTASRVQEVNQLQPQWKPEIYEIYEH